MLLLGHKFPRVRKATAEHLYVSMLAEDSIISAAQLDEASAILLDTPWDASLDVVRPARNTLCGLFGVKPPTAVTAAKAPAGAVAAPVVVASDESMQSYKDLVDRAGY
jgi:hypothetical protein